MRTMRLPDRVEWPTVAVATLTYAGFCLLTWFHAELPLWVFIPLGAYLAALQSSLQHEVVHGHPTPWARVNRALIFPSLWLWLPFPLYRDSHLRHHDDEHLTCPRDDPESFYVAPEDWRGRGPLRRAWRWALNSFAGRLLLGPPHVMLRFWWWSLRSLLRGDRRTLLAWSAHLLAVALPLAWAVGVAELPLWLYLVTFFYAGTSLALIRSFLEHQAHPAVGQRTVAIEAGPVFALLFLNNNLHVLHHAEPGLAWYRLPRRWRQRRAELLQQNGGYVYSGYLEVALRYFLRPKEPPVHPGWQQSGTLRPRRSAVRAAEAA